MLRRPPTVRRRRASAAVVVASLFALAPLALATPATAQIDAEPISCLPKVALPPAPPALTPWFYETDSGEYLWGEHQFYEDPGNTVFSLAREMVALGSQQPQAYPDLLLFNVAQFEPPEGVATGAAPRRLMNDSIHAKGLQLLVNYSDALIDPAFADRYGKPTFFQSLDGYRQNVQTIPPVPFSGFSRVDVSATRGAFGCAFQQVAVHTAGPPVAPLPGPALAGAGALQRMASPLEAVPLTCDELYVTAGLAYGLPELDPDPVHQALAAQAQTDLLMHRDPTTGIWSDIAQDPCPGGPRIPASATAGNSSGVVFADLTGDGRADLYVGLQGDGATGAKNVLLVNTGGGCFADQTAARIPGEPVRATNEIAAADVDADGDLDLVVANRCRRDGPCGAESEDELLVNDGSGNFTVVGLAPGVWTDSRSVAVGDLNKDGWPEIVLGNAGSDGLSNTLALPPAEDHRLQILVNRIALGGTLNQFTDFMDPILDPFGPSYPIEHEVTAPLTQQVLLVDLFHPAPAGSPPFPASLNTPDGWLDLVIVSHRDIIKNDTPFAAGSRVYVLSNAANWSGPPPWLRSFTAFPSDWVRTVAVADFNQNGFKDLFEARGNRWSGVLAGLHSNLGDQPPATGGVPWDFGLFEFLSYEAFPGTEHGYGLDFADVDGDGAQDALQTSRGYDYLVKSILGAQEAEHEELALPSLGSGATSNMRGRQVPQGMEDGVFADFDEDGDLDALMASQRTPAWPHCQDTSPDSIVLVNDGSGAFGYDAASPPVPCSTDDARIDVNNRDTAPLPSIGDRAVAGDLDNDGDADAIVHLFQLNPQGYPFEPTLPVAPPAFPAPTPEYAFGWRYLQNITGEPGAGNFWFKDVAPSRMRLPAGGWDPNWNRGLGMDVLADFDNNGGLDLYTTVGFAKMAPEQVVNAAQAQDLLFMNGVGGTVKGVLTESSATLLPAPCQDIVQDLPNEPQYDSCGSFGLAQGDVDNDGDADVVVNHYAQTGRTNYPWLLINRIPQTGQLVDEFGARVPVATFSPSIHTAAQDFVGFPTPGMDHAMFPVLADLDADGDLDLVYHVVNDLLRVLVNDGRDSNGDGLITAADSPPPGTFTDRTDATLKRLKASTDSQDLVAVDIDRDGDLDLANDPFSDRVTFWRNDIPADPGRPAVAEAWPRVGSVRRKTVRLEGVNLTGVVKVQLRFAGGAVCEQTATTPIGTDGRRLDFVIPATCPLGLAQVRVLRALPACDADGTATPLLQRWSRQYFGYFVLG